MKADNFKPFYAIVALLFIVVMAQGYFIYDLKKESGQKSVQLVENITTTKTPVQFTSNSVDPFVQMQKMQEEMMKSFGHFNSVFSNDPFFQDAFAHMSASPLADIKEDDKSYTLELNIPGADDKKIDISTDNSVLSVSATSQKSVDTNNSNYIHKERSSQYFERSFSLPQNADLERLQSNYDKGVLTIVVPKKS